jgi:hypothetical protein
MAIKAVAIAAQLAIAVITTFVVASWIALEVADVLARGISDAFGK